MSDTRIIKESDLGEKQVSVPEGHDLYYFKIVGIGPKTLSESGGLPGKIPEVVPGFFILGSRETIEADIHDIVKRAFEHRKNQMESQNG
jgi:hypothetical protein